MSNSASCSAPFSPLPTPPTLKHNALGSTAIALRIIRSDLSRVRQWSQHFNVPSQTALEATGWIPMVAPLVLDTLRADGSLVDTELVRNALSYGFTGEALYAKQGADVPYAMRTPETTLAEYLKARDLVSRFPEDCRPWIRRAILLRFASTDDTSRFPEEAQGTLADLRRCKDHEIRAFRLIQHLVYLIYALAEYEIQGNIRTLIECLKNVHAKLSNDARFFPAFSSRLYPPTFREWAEEMLRLYGDFPPEQLPTHR